MTRPTTAAVARSLDGTEIGYTSLGAGDGLLVVGGALRGGRDYMRLAQALASSNHVHVIDRRGRGRSGPQGAEYGIEREVEDLLAVRAQTGAPAVFGHSYGGLIALEAARQSSALSEVVVYEPAVSVGGSIPSSWMPRYRQLLVAGDERGAFAAMVRGVGFAPAPLARMPLWYVRLILRLFVRGHQWQIIEPHLATSLLEHQEVTSIDDGTVERYRAVTARVLLLGGRKSPRFVTTELFGHLQAVIANSTSRCIDGLDHTAPDEKAPELVADLVCHHLRA